MNVNDLTINLAGTIVNIIKLFLGDVFIDDVDFDVMATEKNRFDGGGQLVDVSVVGWQSKYFLWQCIPFFC